MAVSYTHLKEIDEYSYLPNQKFDADNEFDKWVNSADFTMQLFDGKFNIVNQSEPVSSTSINLIKYEDLEIKSNDDNITLYSFEAVSYTHLWFYWFGAGRKFEGAWH